MEQLLGHVMAFGILCAFFVLPGLLFAGIVKIGGFLSSGPISRGDRTTPLDPD